MAKNGKHVNPELPQDVVKEIQKATSMRAKAKMHEEEAVTLKDQANEILLPMMKAFDVGKYHVKGVGYVATRAKSGWSINEKKLRENMVLAGIDPDTVETVIGSSTTSWSTEYVEFRRG